MKKHQDENHSLKENNEEGQTGKPSNSNEVKKNLVDSIYKMKDCINKLEYNFDQTEFFFNDSGKHLPGSQKKLNEENSSLFMETRNLLFGMFMLLELSGSEESEDKP